MLPSQVVYLTAPERAGPPGNVVSGNAPLAVGGASQGNERLLACHKVLHLDSITCDAPSTWER